MTSHQELRRVLALTFAIAAAAGCAGGSRAAAQAHYESLDWTSDGDSLVVSLEGNLYVVPATGAPGRRLTDAEPRDVFASWAPDGSAVAFTSDRDGDTEIVVAGPDGASARAVTDNDVEDSYPSWSPDGKRLAFMRKDGEHWQLWTVSADGSDARRLTRSAGNDYNPRWSPAGDRIVFESDRHGGDQDEIYLIGADGAGERRLTESPANDIYPAWSPDGNRIGYCTIEGGRAFVHVLAVEGGEPRRIVEDACLPAWSARGRLAYVAVRAGEPEQLRVAGADGSDPVVIPDPREHP